MRPYLDLLRHVLDHGERRTDRTGTGTISLFGAQTRYDLRDGFPLVTTKKVLFPAVVRELLWFLRGSTNINDELTQHTPIWDAWADASGELGPIYGHQWRSWGGRSGPTGDAAGRGGVAERSEGMGGGDPAGCAGGVGGKAPRGIERSEGIGGGDPAGYAGGAGGKAPRGIERSEGIGGGDPAGCAGGAGGKAPRGIDQIAAAIATIKRDPTSRRIIVSAWNVADLPAMRLPPCHALFQFYVHAGHLDCQLYQRSADLALGVPFNIASYALLTAMIAKECKLEPRSFVHTLGDAHIYSNHVEGVKLQLAREPLPLPRLVLADKPVLDQRYEDIALEGYQHHPFIKFPVAV